MSLRQGFLVSWVDSPTEYRSVFAEAAGSGFGFVELNMEAAFHRTHVDTRAVGEAARAHGLDLVVHLPYRFDMCSPHEHVRDGACRELEAAVDAAIEMGADRGVMHAGSLAEPERWGEQPIREGIRDSVRRLTEYGIDRGFEVVGENLKGMVDAEELPTFLADTHSDATMCLDTGHAFVTGMDGEGQAALLREYGDRISHLHLNDTRIHSDDEHLPLGLGTVDFEPLATALTETDWTGTCTHEVFTYDYSRVAQGKTHFDELLAAASED
ncbi:sugar phosphate isomerase/epimerase family protein [Haloarchaeobius sp. DT45]|uniref:sugar phosphate isomerase/epimerase family protein n=1 Tax=Haloarchaeobius sp. DT45 TaxID=3446116 RepID=UPI003F6B0C53